MLIGRVYLWMIHRYNKAGDLVLFDREMLLHVITAFLAEATWQAVRTGPSQPHVRDLSRPAVTAPQRKVGLQFHAYTDVGSSFESASLRPDCLLTSLKGDVQRWNRYGV